MSRRIHWGGLVIAGIGFFVTRFTVTLAYEEPVRFFVAGVLPLAIGLGLAAFGVALAIANVEPAVVRTTAQWCVLGMASMFVFGLLTIYGTATSPIDLSGTLFRSSLSNFLIVGSVGGTLTGLYAGRSRQHRRQLRRHTNRLVVLNRLLRHEVLNAVTAIRGFTTLDASYTHEARDVVADRTEAIERTIEKVKYLTRRPGDRTDRTMPIDVDGYLESVVAAVEERHPDVSVSIAGDTAGLRVWADEQLEAVLSELLENAVVHGGDTEPTVSVSATPSSVHVTVRDDGPGLPPEQQRLLETGDVGEFDDPTTGFGLNLVRFHVSEFDGTIETDVGEAGTEITVSLSRAREESNRAGPSTLDFAGVRPAMPHLAVAVGAALVAGVAYGIVSELLGGSVAGIGVFYGTVDPVVGWITHEFHSVVFGLVFIGLLSLVPEAWPDSYRTYLGIGVGWALVVWVGAAGIVAPVWLQLSGFPVDVPNFSVRLLANHVAWGLTLAVATSIGYRVLPPSVSGPMRGQRSEPAS